MGESNYQIVRGVFYRTTDVAESKMARDVLCFAIKTAVVGRDSRISETRGNQCAEYFWGTQLQIARRLITVG